VLLGSNLGDLIVNTAWPLLFVVLSLRIKFMGEAN